MTETSRKEGQTLKLKTNKNISTPRYVIEKLTKFQL